MQKILILTDDHTGEICGAFKNYHNLVTYCITNHLITKDTMVLILDDVIPCSLQEYQNVIGDCWEHIIQDLSIDGFNEMFECMYYIDETELK